MYIVTLNHIKVIGLIKYLNIYFKAVSIQSKRAGPITI
jgi:hypothetical protein